MNDHYEFDVSLVSEDVWLDFWRMNGNERISILHVDNTADMAQAIVFDVNTVDVAASTEIEMEDKKFETLDPIKHSDTIICNGKTYDIICIDIVRIGDMRIYSTKARKKT